MSITRLLSILFLLSGLTVHGQDYVEVVDDPFQVLPPSATPANPRQLTYLQAKDLITATLQPKYSQNPPLVDDPSFYCIIHTVVWKQPAHETGKPEIDFKRWYVFRGGPNWGQLELEGTRIYGSRKVALLSVQWTQAVERPGTESQMQSLLTAQKRDEGAPGTFELLQTRFLIASATLPENR